MKKAVVVSLLLLAVLIALSSCSHIRKFDSCHPVNHPMSKWEGDAEGLHFELYIGDEEHEDFMVIDYGIKKISYLVFWHQNYASQMSLNDVRECTLDENESPTYQSPHLERSNWDIELIDETHCKFVSHGVGEIEDATSNIPELMMPTEIVMMRTQSELNKENFPEIEADESYGLCPTYRYGTQWISDDNKVIIENIKSGYNSTAGTSKVTFVEEPDSVYYIGFFELDHKAYLLKWEEETYFTASKFAHSKEEWQCEYFENYFVAQVIRSEHYDPGHILTFTLVDTPLDSNE